MNKVFFTFFALLLTIISFSKSYANDDLVFNSETKTVKELKEDIENYEIDKEKLDLKFKNFLKTYKISEYFKQKLTKNEYNNFKNLSEKYLEEKNILTKKLQDKSKSLEDTKEIEEKLLNLKKDLYKNLTIYIKEDKIKAYKDFIKSDVKIYSEKNSITSEKIKVTKIYKAKVKNLEEQVQTHKDSIRQAISDKLDEKFNQVFESENFLNLKNSEKISILTKTIKKLEEKREILQKEQDELKENTNKNINFIRIEINKNKLAIYDISIEKLYVFTEKLEKEEDLTQEKKEEIQKD